MILVRHAHAGAKATWRGPDEMRPLSPTGLAQAGSLVAMLAVDEVTHVWCSPAVRCRQTVEPLASARGLVVRTSSHLSKAGHPRRLLAWLQEAGVDAPWVICTHGEVLTALHAVGRREGVVGTAPRSSTAKGAVWRLSATAPGPVRMGYTPPRPAE